MKPTFSHKGSDVNASKEQTQPARGGWGRAGQFAGASKAGCIQSWGLK